MRAAPSKGWKTQGGWGKLVLLYESVFQTCRTHERLVQLQRAPHGSHTRLAHPPAADKHSHANGTLFLESARGITTFALNRD